LTFLASEGLAVALGIVFALAAAPKVRHPRRFARAVGSYGLLPSRLAPAAATLLVAAESMLAVGHLSGQGVPVVAAMGLLVGAAMLAGSAVLSRQGTDVPCFCFDSTGLERIGMRTVVRAGMVVAGEGALLVSGLRTSTLTAEALLVALSLLGVAAWVLAWPETRQAWRSDIPQVHFSVNGLEVEP